jgi:hypothetical protein
MDPPFKKIALEQAQCFLKITPILLEDQGGLTKAGDFLPKSRLECGFYFFDLLVSQQTADPLPPVRATF